jgi:hypothetical protein
MERRKRVEAIMSSKLFREELERVVSDSLRESGAEGISDMLSNMLNVRYLGLMLLFCLACLTRNKDGKN